MTDAPQSSDASTRPRLSRKALWAFICGLLSAPTLALSAVPALLLGVLALLDVQRAKGALRGQGWAVSGIVLALVEIPVLIAGFMLFSAASWFWVGQNRPAEFYVRLERVSEGMENERPGPSEGAVIADRLAAAEAEFQSVANALELFRLDNGWFPSNLTPSLTSPIPYLPAVPRDPFDPRRGALRYHVCPDGGWRLQSAGPDGDYDLPPAAFHSVQEDDAAETLLAPIYDPTNGTLSDGDLLFIREP